MKGKTTTYKMTANDLFQEMCKLTAAIPFCYDPKIYSVKYLAERMKQSKYMIRKQMKKLEAVGLVCRDYDGGADEDGRVYCYHGWSITEKAMKTALYKRLEKEAAQEFNDFMKQYDNEALREEVKNNDNS